MNLKRTMLGMLGMTAAMVFPLVVFAENDDLSLCDEITLICDAVNQEARVECKQECPQPIGSIDDPGYEGYTPEIAACYMECNIFYHDFKEIVCDNVCGGGDDGGEE